MIHKNMANRRRQDKLKAKRKQKIAKEIYGFDYYPHLGQYDKGKIHCSCPMCQSKTNTKRSKSKGPVDDSMRQGCLARGSRIPATNHRLGKKDYKHSEAKEIVGMKQALAEIYDDTIDQED